MIITTGKIVRIESGQFQFEKSAETPGRVRVTGTRHFDGAIDLPGNEEEARRFCAAYLRSVSEDVGYRKVESE